MSFTPDELEFCKSFVDELISHPLSFLFRDSNSTDPQNRKTLNLLKIRDNLNNHQYTNSHMWKEDIMSIWENASHNSSASLQNKAADFFKAKCQKKLEHIPKTATDRWLLNFQKATKQLNKLLQFAEESAIDSDLITRSPELELSSNFTTI